MLFNFFDVFTVVFWIKIWIFAETLTSSMNPIITNSILPTDLQISRISRTRLAFWTVKSYGALPTSLSSKVIFADTNILWDKCMLGLSWAGTNIFNCSLTISVIMTRIITKFWLNAHTVMKNRLQVNLFHDFFFNSALVVDFFYLSMDWGYFLWIICWSKPISFWRWKHVIAWKHLSDRFCWIDFWVNR